jgi:hypothetical protein
MSKKTRLIAIVLLLALCVMGVGYTAWMDEVSIEGTLTTGYIQVVLSPGAGSDPEISCYVSAPYTLVVTLTDAEPGTYTCGFTISNTGTIPVKIQSIALSGVPAGVGVSVDSGVAEGTQIEQAGVSPDSVNGVVTVTVPQENGKVSFTFYVDFSFIQWNL